MYCKFCGGQNPDDAAYCASCARPLREETAPQPPLTATPPPGYEQAPPQDAGGPYTCVVCGYVLGPAEPLCARCKTPRGMSVNPNADMPGTYMPVGGAWTPPAPDKTGWSPANLIPVLTAPVEYFQRQRGQVDMVQPILFFLIITTLEFAIAGVFGMFGAQGMSMRRLGMGGGVGALVFILLSPLIAGIALAFLLAIAGLFHLFVHLFGGRGGYPGTFRAMVYSSAPTVVLGVLSAALQAAGPGAAILGSLVSLVAYIWAFVLLVIAFREIHGLSTGSAFAAAFLPGAILFVLFIVFIAVLFGAMFAAIGGAAGGGGFGRP